MRHRCPDLCCKGMLRFFGYMFNTEHWICTSCTTTWEMYWKKVDNEGDKEGG